MISRNIPGICQWLAGVMHTTGVNEMILLQTIWSAYLTEFDAAGTVGHESRKTPAIAAVEASFVVTSVVRQLVLAGFNTRAIVSVLLGSGGRRPKGAALQYCYGVKGDVLAL